MKVLVIGAGVLGSLYAGRLQASGHQVTLLARGERLEQIKTQGLVLVDHRTGIRTITKVPVVDQISQNDHYELVILLVRKNQLHDLIPTIASNKNIPSFLFMVNSASGFDEYFQVIGRERVLLGFPGAGGYRDPSGKVDYSILPAFLQSTQIGEVDGSNTPRLIKIASLFRDSGFPTEIQKNMDAWLKTHVALVSPIANAIYLADGDVNRLAETRDGLIMLIRAIREGFHVLDHLAIPVVPGRLKILRYLPESILIAILKMIFKSPKTELIMARHARSARDEMRQLALEFQHLIIHARVPTLNIDNLMRYVDIDMEPLPVGSRTIKVCRQDWTIMLLAIVGFLFGVILVHKHRNK
ncbi:MAG: ketopantoate reductase family protein [Anaerolineaceae bacterium]|nr:ketopantoate reductase family protein [Anaerolineaceae bacterium]